LFPAVVSVTRDARASKTVVLKLVEELGFVGVDPGGLDESWRQPPGTLVTPTVCGAPCMKKDRTQEWRGTSNSPGSFTGLA
jgi:8-hydroxy-5-deazaflavin:NADPH oxidoreductase